MARKGKLDKKPARDVTKRPERLQRYKYIFLIVCEDEKTEPEYFSQFVSLFPPKTLYLKPVGAGRDSLGVVEHAIREKTDLFIEIEREVDFVWVVFDRDDAHLEDVNCSFCWNSDNLVKYPPMHREDIYKRIQEAINKHPNYSNYVYDHRKPLKTQKGIIEVINEIGDESEAIKRAEVLLQIQHGVVPLIANPSTKVHLLVQEIREWAKYFHTDF
jgi:hypothetical protein